MNLQKYMEKNVPKPAKVGGTRWIAHKFRAMTIVLQNYVIFIAHLESLAHTDSQSLKKAEIEGFVKKWKYAKFPLHLAIYLDVLTPLKVLSLSMQKDKHDPVTMLRRVQEFSWTMAKLQMLVANSLDGNSSRLTNYIKFMQEVLEDDGGNKVYQNIKLKEFHSSKRALEESLGEMVTRICCSVEERFADLSTSPIYKHLVSILDVSCWPLDERSLLNYGDSAIDDLIELWKELLKTNGCVTMNIPAQWDVLKNRMQPMLVSLNQVKYLEIWSRILTNNDLKNECSDVLHIIELLLITPFMNAKLEHMFSRMNRVKTDWRNRLRRDRLDSCLRIGEEGKSIEEFNPNKAIKAWFEHKVRRISAAKKPHRYPKKRKTTGSASDCAVDIVRYTLPDLEDTDSDRE
jgi:hypothetical protein